MIALPWQQQTVEDTPPVSALIVTGDAGIGAGELALALADKCCGASEDGDDGEAAAVNPDILITLPHGHVIPVAAVRYVAEFLSFAPVRRRRRAAVLLRADRLHISAANALLKTLEEPHEDKSLVLWSPALQQLPATLISRCHVIAAPTPPPDAAPALTAAALAFCGQRPLAAQQLPADWGETLAGFFCQGAEIDIPTAAAAFDVQHEGEAHWQQVMRRCLENGAHLNPHCLDWAEKSLGNVHVWLEGMQKWVADGVRVAHALPPLFFPAHEGKIKALVGDNRRRWLDFYRHLLERRALITHSLAKPLFIKEVLYDYRHLCAC